MNHFFRNRHQTVAVFFTVFSLICCYGLYRPSSANCGNPIAEELISLDTENQPLGEVLEDISAETGYQFSIDESWNDFPVTASIKNEPLHRGLKRILRNLNNAVIYGSDGTIRIKIYEQEKSSGDPAGHSIVNRSYEETIRQPVRPRNPPALNSSAQLRRRQRPAQTAEQDSGENSESDEAAEETDEQSDTADKEEAVDSESEPAENASAEGEEQAAETDVNSENTSDSEAVGSD